jgi:flagellar hook-associated protein 2
MSSVSALNSLLSSGNSSSSINLSQILEAALGASSEGIDVNAAVSSAISAAEAPEQTWESQYSTLQNQTSALNQLQTAATNLDNDMQSLNNVVGPLSARTVSSSNSSLVTASAASGSATGNHVVQVSNLATTASWTSGTFASGTTALPAGNFTITTGSGSTATITTDGTETLSDVASQINGDNLGVSASVITDATGSRLAIVANSSGSTANFTVSTGSSGFGFTQAVTGANASLTVDGIAISSASNTVTGIIPGLTLNLLSADPGAYVSLGVGPDTTQSAAAINQFVTDYNTAIQALNTQFTDTGSGEGVLATDSNVRNLQSDLEGAISYLNKPASGTTSVSTLASLGITVNTDGTLSVDNGTLNSALSNNYSDVQSFFQGAALNGFANSLDQQLTNFISPADGAFTIDLQSISTQETGLQTDITNFQTNVIAPMQTQLQSEYSKAEILLQQLPTQMKQINEELGLNNSSN